MIKTIKKTIPRLDDWRSRLFDYVNSCRDRRFDGSTFNCGIFIGGAVEAMTGENIHDPLGRYWGVEGGMERLSSMGFSSIEEYFDSLFIPYQHHSQASEGDIGLVRINGQDLCGLFTHGRVIVLSDERGLMSFKSSSVRKAYKV